MAIDERNPYAVDGFKVGMVNVITPYKIPKDALSDAMNVDIDDFGYIRRRDGYEQIRSGVIHSLYSLGSTALFGDGTTIRLMRADETSTELVNGLSGAPISYVELNGEVYWSNGSQSGVINGSVNRSWGIPAGPIPVVAVSATGVLPAGKYQVACTYVRNTGEEGGTFQSSQITLGAAGGIVVSIPAAAPAADITHVNVYCSTENGEQEYYVRSVALGSGSTTITTLATAGRTLTTQGYGPFPTCTDLEVAHGRIFGAYGVQVVYTPPMRYSLHRPNRDFFMFKSPVRMIAAAEDGLYVSDDSSTYWLNGTDPEKVSMVEVFPYPAVAGTKVYDPADGTTSWFSERGWIVGKDGGKAENVMEKRVIPGVVSPTGAGLFREYNGIKQVVAIVDETAPHSLTV
jgi:hypothetical protein